MPTTKWFISAAALLLANGCKDHPKVSVQKDTSVVHTLNAPTNSLTGTWCGMFEPIRDAKTLDKSTGDSTAVPSTKITLFIDQMEGGQIWGYSVCAGNDRPFKGTYTEDSDRITANLKEPGDNKYDGVFDLVISKTPPLTISGKWAPLNPAQASRTYTLARRNFVYDPSAGKFPESSTRFLTSEDVNNLYKEDLRYMRNAIYARHGYSFKLTEVRAWFDNEDWYMPVSTDVRKKLTPIESANEKLIKQFEKYADDSYDDYGR